MKRGTTDNGPDHREAALVPQLATEPSRDEFSRAEANLAEPRASASPAQVEAAVLALDQDQLASLMATARFRIRSLGGGQRGRSAEDLLQEAILRTLSGQRAWNLQVDFLRHLHGALRSIVWEWRTRAQRGDGAEQAVGQDEAAIMERSATGQPDQEREQAARSELAALELRFAGDPLALSLIHAWGEGCKGPEVQQRLGIDVKAYRALVKRIRRAAWSLLRDRGYGGSRAADGPTPSASQAASSSKAAEIPEARAEEA